MKQQAGGSRDCRRRLARVVGIGPSVAVWRRRRRRRRSGGGGRRLCGPPQSQPRAPSSELRQVCAERTTTLLLAQNCAPQRLDASPHVLPYPPPRRPRPTSAALAAAAARRVGRAYRPRVLRHLGPVLAVAPIAALCRPPTSRDCVPPAADEPAHALAAQLVGRREPAGQGGRAERREPDGAHRAVADAGVHADEPARADAAGARAAARLAARRAPRAGGDRLAEPVAALRARAAAPRCASSSSPPTSRAAARRGRAPPASAPRRRAGRRLARQPPPRRRGRGAARLFVQVGAAAAGRARRRPSCRRRRRCTRRRRRRRRASPSRRRRRRSRRRTRSAR